MTPEMARAAPGTGTARHVQHPDKSTDPLSHATVPDDASATRADALAMVAVLLDALPDPAAEVELRRQLAREAARDAWRAGYQAGYERAEADMARRWREIARPVVHTDPDLTHDALEILRWGPGGREHFGDRCPGDRTPAEILARARASWELNRKATDQKGTRAA